jgi:hypothetical protein
LDFFPKSPIFSRAFSIAVGVKSRKAGEGKSKKVKGKRETVGMNYLQGRKEWTTNSANWTGLFWRLGIQIVDADVQDLGGRQVSGGLKTVSPRRREERKEENHLGALCVFAVNGEAQ